MPLLCNVAPTYGENSGGLVLVFFFFFLMFLLQLDRNVALFLLYWKLEANGCSEQKAFVVSGTYSPWFCDNNVAWPAQGNIFSFYELWRDRHSC